MEVLELFEKYHDGVYRLALHMTGSPADAEDISQTVFLKLLDREQTCSPAGKRRGFTR